MSPFALGDVVRVRGTAQVMVVLRCDDRGTWCAWIDHASNGDAYVESHVCETESLELVPSSERP